MSDDKVQPIFTNISSEHSKVQKNRAQHEAEHDFQVRYKILINLRMRHQPDHL